jgi:hypothetical protein
MAALFVFFIRDEADLAFLGRLRANSGEPEVSENLL